MTWLLLTLPVLLWWFCTPVPRIFDVDSAQLLAALRAKKR